MHVCAHRLLVGDSGRMELDVVKVGGGPSQSVKQGDFYFEILLTYSI